MGRIRYRTRKAIKTRFQRNLKAHDMFMGDGQGNVDSGFEGRSLVNVDGIPAVLVNHAGSLVSGQRVRTGRDWIDPDFVQVLANRNIPGAGGGGTVVVTGPHANTHYFWGGGGGGGGFSGGT